MTLSRILEGIRPADEAAKAQACQRLHDMGKPLGSLGVLEEDLIALAGAQGTPDVDLSRRRVAVFCADNGVVAQGVTQCGQEVTAIVTENLARRATTVCIMADHSNCDVLPINIGVARPVSGEKILQRPIRMGTADMTREPAMTPAECEAAILVGVETALRSREEGYRILLTGEMGIGNTTSSSAVASVLLGTPVEEMTGRGAGLSSEGLARKIGAIRTAIALHAPDPANPLDVLSKVGGLDLAGMVGLCLGGAYCRTPVLLDGFISNVAALIAVRLCPSVSDYILASHVSAEPAGRRLLEALGKKPLLCAEMRLGEGTGAVAALGPLDLMTAVYREMLCFDEIGVDHYETLV